MKQLKNALSIVLITLLISMVLQVPNLGHAQGRFSDVQPDHWAHDRINWLAGQGVLQGYPDGTFRPDNPIRRGDMAILLCRLLQTGTLTPTASSFADVSVNDYDFPFIEVVRKTQLMSDSISGNQFRPNEKLTRIEFAPIIVRTLAMKYFADKLSPMMISETVQGFIDRADIPAWSQKYLTIAVKAELMRGFPDGSFRPHEDLTRAQIAYVLYEILFPDPADDGKATHLFTDVNQTEFHAILTRKLAPSLFRFSGQSIPGGKVSMVFNDIPMKEVQVLPSGEYTVLLPICFIHVGEIKFKATYHDQAGNPRHSFDFYSSTPFDLFPNWHRAYALSYYPLQQMMVYESTLAHPMSIEVNNKTTDQ